MRAYIFKGDIQPQLLHAQLLTSHLEFKYFYVEKYGSIDGVKLTMFDIKEYLSPLTLAQRSLLSEVCQTAKLVFMMAATNATSERSFSTLRRVKFFLRSSMTQQRLNNLMILLVHKDLTDKPNLMDIANEFIRDSEHRLTVFGKIK